MNRKFVLTAAAVAGAVTGYTFMEAYDLVQKRKRAKERHEAFMGACTALRTSLEKQLEDQKFWAIVKEQ